MCQLRQLLYHVVQGVQLQAEELRQSWGQVTLKEVADTLQIGLQLTSSLHYEGWVLTTYHLLRWQKVPERCKYLTLNVYCRKLSFVCPFYNIREL